MLRLSDHIASAGGWLGIDHFMELALYDPEEGYYMASIRDIGIRGDFSTSATLSPLLARSILREWKEACRIHGKRLPLIEIGGGNGSLAMAFMRELGFLKRLQIRYHLVESSPVLRNLQHLALGSQARIHETMEAALESCRGEAFIFSNELVDAFPARVFEYRPGEWMEVGLSVEKGHLVERLIPPLSLPVSTALECESNPGQRIEVHESYHQWFASWLPLWKAGVMTTIDYGDTLQQLYLRRPKGTLRAYRAHLMFTGMDVYQEAGKRDITCDVNFSDLLRILEYCIGDDISLVNQRDYFLPSATPDEKDIFLMQTKGAGDHFKVLVQKRLKQPA